MTAAMSLTQPLSTQMTLIITGKYRPGGPNLPALPYLVPLQPGKSFTFTESGFAFIS